MTNIVYISEKDMTYECTDSYIIYFINSNNISNHWRVYNKLEPHVENFKCVKMLFCYCPSSETPIR